MNKESLSMIEGFAPFGEYQTWYRLIGNLKSDQVPLVVLHGGPGCTHDYLQNLIRLSETGRAVVLYDQIGNGHSTHLPEKKTDFWTVELFLRELDNLLAHLKIKESYDLLGQSWGGMLAAEHAVRRPAGLNALIVANSPTSISRWASEALRLRAQLPLDVQATLEKYEALEQFDHPDYKMASDVFYQRHVCRLEPWPDFVQATFDWIDRDPTVYHTMIGPTEFHTIGTLKNWTIEDQLHLIQAPTLVVSGAHDEATPYTTELFAQYIPDAHWHVFGQSSHMPHVEQEEEYMAVIGNFLELHDQKLPSRDKTLNFSNV